MGLGKNPVRTLLLVNLITWAVACIFTIQSSILLLFIGGVIWMFFGSYAEAAEQTTLQKVVPYEAECKASFSCEGPARERQLA